MLFVPWRDESVELLCDDIVGKAQRLIDQIYENSKPYYIDRNIDENVLNNLIEELEEETYDEIDQDDDEDSLVIEDEEPYGHEDAFVDNISSARCEQFLPPRLIDDQNYTRIMRSLCEKQRRFILNVLFKLKSYSSPFYMFLHGGAGVGKSHLITAIVQSHLRLHSKTAGVNPDDTCVIVTAPTGKAAFNVNGMTLHCAFKLPPTQYGGRLCPLDDGAVNILRLKLHSVKLIIVDEISMVSVKQLYEIDQRLQQIFCTTADFGGRSVIVCGHFRQLPPVMGSHVFKPPKHLPLGECVGNHLWKKFQFFEMDEIMRQRNQFTFCKALNNMSEGCMDEQDVEFIKRTEIGPNHQPPDNAIRLFKTNEECRIFNSEIYENLNTEGVLSTASDKIQGKFT